MWKRGGRRAILPSLMLLFTSLGLASARPAAADQPPAFEPAPAPAAPAAPPPDATPPPAAAPPPEAPAPAEDAPPPAAAPVPADTASTTVEATHRRLVPSLSHEMQFGIAALPGDGYRIVIPYTKDATDCGDKNVAGAHVCTSRAPLFIDLQPSFGISNAWDILVDLRFGLEKDYNTFHDFFVMPGFRYWLETETHAKFFTTMQLAYDGTTQQATSKHTRSDFGFRNSNGLMIEVMRNLGFYFQFGETIGFVRWLSFTIDGGLGVQARMP